MKTREKMYAVVVMMFVVCAFLFASYLDSPYTMTATVQEYKGGYDALGEVWSDDRVEEYNIGDEVKLTFNMMCTEHSRYDDKGKRVDK